MAVSTNPTTTDTDDSTDDQPAFGGLDEKAYFIVRRNRAEFRNVPHPDDGPWLAVDVFPDDWGSSHTRRLYNVGIIDKYAREYTVVREEPDLAERIPETTSDSWYWVTTGPGWRTLKAAGAVDPTPDNDVFHNPGQPSCPDCGYNGMCNHGDEIECRHCGAVNPKEAWR